ncbi:LlaJI restriction endonuclease [Fibrobacter sp. UWT2]|uniref:LlaJI family restriction endonuclease n=1 Tax=Fibrobacter sp. UWT2 TaxID=1896224 RepID=UPI00091FF512|nr:LlaJI family restriction endonuclease [Fibrobacter sp. UWT2]SHL44084.1 LlaJI restriction endonuclease [Fibrobacter sp. UWT2]
MIFLFEEFPYDPTFLKTVIGYGDGDSKSRSKSGFNTETIKAGVKIDGVGYCFYNGQPVFVLPKVFLEYEKDERGNIVKDEHGYDVQKAFDVRINRKGEDVLGGQNDLENAPLVSEQRHFFSSLSLWLYSAIDKYHKKGDKDTGIETPLQKEHLRFKKSDRYATLLDVMSSMELFYKKNQSLFVFIAKNKHSGNHKINWQRTVNKTIPFMQNGVPIYMNPVNKVKVFDLDDRLLVLYFSAMKYILDKFGYQMPQSEFYQPLRMIEMERLLENERGLRELKKIKYKYFEDRLVKLYNVMEAFFEWGAQYSNTSNNAQEYLIANSFNNVFEAMIDELVGDPDAARLKKNSDGKIIDHLYKEKSLIFASNQNDFNNDLIWHIGDSKYYQDPEDIRGQSIAKQFTYAKNVMQDFFNPAFFRSTVPHVSDAHRGIHYRDSLTDGYSVTPNFFIRGFAPNFVDKKQYQDPYLRNDDNEKLIAEVDDADTFDDGEGDQRKNIKQHLWKNRNRHFINRLFDRDTLLLQVYNVNFLYVLKAFTSSHSSLREEFKREARKQFRENFLKLLDEKYEFYILWPHNIDFGEADEPAEQKFVNRYFRLLIGKIYRPEGAKFLLLAIEKIPENTHIQSERVELENIEKMWGEISGACDCFHVSSRELFPTRQNNLQPVSFAQGDYYFDDDKFGFFVRRNAVENARIGVEHRLPEEIDHRSLEGSIFGDIDLARIERNRSPLDEYYFLPCKEV